jgi:hypothetical protein
MYDNCDRDRELRLRQMMDTALLRRNGNHIEAKQDVERWVRQLRIYDGFDATALAERADRFANGAKVDWADPLLKGGPKRPLDRTSW